MESCPSGSEEDTCPPALDPPSQDVSEEEAEEEPLKKKWTPPVRVPLFPTDMEVEDISENNGISLQTPYEAVRLGGGYCVMWMLWLSLRVSNNNLIWKKETTFLQRQAEYKKIYESGLLYTRDPAKMADSVLQVIAKDQGRRTTRCRLVKDSTGKVRNTKGDPYADMKVTNEKFVKPTRTILQKRAEGKFYFASLAHNGYDLFVQSTNTEYTNLCTKPLEELIKKADKPILLFVYRHPRLGGTSAHALAAIYYPKEYCQDTKTPEFHILSTYTGAPEEQHSIKTMIPHVFQPTATAGRRRTQRRNMRKKRKQTSKRMR